MDERTKELIAIGVSVGAHCQPYLAYHETIEEDLKRLQQASCKVGQ